MVFRVFILQGVVERMVRKNVADSVNTTSHVIMSDLLSWSLIALPHCTKKSGRYRVECVKAHQDSERSHCNSQTRAVSYPKRQSLQYSFGLSLIYYLGYYVTVYLVHVVYIQARFVEKRAEARLAV